MYSLFNVRLIDYCLLLFTFFIDTSFMKDLATPAAVHKNSQQAKRKAKLRHPTSIKTQRTKSLQQKKQTRGKFLSIYH